MVRLRSVLTVGRECPCCKFIPGIYDNCCGCMGLAVHSSEILHPMRTLLDAYSQPRWSAMALQGNSY